MDSENHLIDDYLDGTLSDATHQQLAEWLQEQNDHVREFAIATLIHSLLHDFASERQVQADALLRAMTMRSTDSLAQQVGSGNGHLSARSAAEHPFVGPCEVRMQLPKVGGKRGRRWRAPVAVATVLLIMVAGAVTFFATRPKVVAMLTQTAACRWETTGDKIVADGALFREGDELKLVEGRALVTFVSGAKIILEGPAVLTVQAESSARLNNGRITATVPGQAVGFKVNLPIGVLVDLGTEFTARMQADGKFELQVFDGLVELTPNSGMRGDNAPLRLSEGVAVRFDPTSGRVNSIGYRPEEQMRMP